MATLRPPTQAERAAGLPTSKAEAIKLGLSRFMHPDGRERIIRNYGSRSSPNGNVALASNRKRTRGGGTGGSRQINEALATPDDANTKAFYEAMDSANSKGMDGDHIQEISRTANGIRFKEESGRGTRAQYHNNMSNAGVPVGNQAANVQPLTPDVNQRVKPAEIRAMDNGIQRAGLQSDLIFNSIRNSVRLRTGIAMGGNILMAIGPDLMEIADSKTNGAVSNGINGVVDAGKDLVVDGINGWKNILTSLVGQENRDRATNYGQW